MTLRRTLIALVAALLAVGAMGAMAFALQPTTTKMPAAVSGELGLDGTDITTPSPTARAAPPVSEPAPAPAAPAADAAPPGADPAEAEVLGLVNQARTANGCAALAWDDTLAQVARLHSADMAARDFMDHTNPDGLTPFDRAAAAGTTASAENIAAGQQTAAEVMESWMASPGHHDNIVNCANTRIGIGVGHGGSYGITWTQLFGR
jgi:uncharacterized protein YkwD